MKKLFTLIAMTLCTAFAAVAQDVVVKLDPPAGEVEIGGDARFIVTVTNNTAADLSGELYLTLDGGYPANESDTWLKNIAVKAGETAVFYPTMHGDDVWGPEMLVGVVVRLGGVEYRVGDDDRVSPTFGTPKVSITVGATGWLDLHDEDRNLEVPSTVKAYLVTEFSAAGVKLQQVTRIPALIPVLLEGEGTHVFEYQPVAEDVSSDDPFERLWDQYTNVNLLQNTQWTGNYKLVEAENTVWVLATVDGHVGFQAQPVGTQLVANQTFIEKTLSGVGSFVPLTGVTAVGALSVQTAAPAAAYNLNGQRVAGGYRGVVIADGKKILSK